MSLCEKGKIDMVLTKSVSRFSRNTLDAITYIRKLKAKGIPIIFEKEGINTMQMASEMALCFLSGFAQAESESISRNVTWGKRQQFKNGNVPFQYKRLLGYEKGEDGAPMLAPEQAEIVRRVFHSYIGGASISKIKKSLEADCIPSPTGKAEWSPGVLQYMLRNEHYIGDALLQKTCVVDCISKETRKNNGEIPQYYVTDNHPACTAPSSPPSTYWTRKRRMSSKPSVPVCSLPWVHRQMMASAKPPFKTASPSYRV